MDAVSMSAPGERASAPTSLRMVEGLRRIRRAADPQVVAVKSVSVRLGPDAPRVSVYTNPSR